MLKKISLLLIIVIMTLVVTGCKQQGSETQAYIQGKIYNTSVDPAVGIEGIIVKAVNGNNVLVTQTEESGNYIFQGVGYGSYDVAPSVNSSFFDNPLEATVNVSIDKGLEVKAGIDFRLNAIPPIPGI